VLEANAPPPGRQTRQLASSVGGAERIGSPNNFIERMQIIALLVDQQFRVTDDIDEEDVPNLEPNLFLNFGGHSGTDLNRLIPVLRREGGIEVKPLHEIHKSRIVV